MAIENVDNGGVLLASQAKMNFSLGYLIDSLHQLFAQGVVSDQSGVPPRTFLVLADHSEIGQNV